MARRCCRGSRILAEVLCCILRFHRSERFPALAGGRVTPSPRVASWVLTVRGAARLGTCRTNGRRRAGPAGRAGPGPRDGQRRRGADESVMAWPAGRLGERSGTPIAECGTTNAGRAGRSNRARGQLGDQEKLSDTGAGTGRESLSVAMAEGRKRRADERDRACFAGRMFDPPFETSDRTPGPGQGPARAVT